MRNPFEEMKRPALEKPQGEEVDGTFFCQERGCYEVAQTARYLAEVKVLTWKPKCEHISKMEDFYLG